MTLSLLLQQRPTTTAGRCRHQSLQPLAISTHHHHSHNRCSIHRQSHTTLPHWQTLHSPSTTTHHRHSAHSPHCSTRTTIMHLQSLQFLLQANSRRRYRQPTIPSPLQCCHHSHRTHLAHHLPHLSTATQPSPVQHPLRRQSLHPPQRAFPTCTPYHHTCPSRFLRTSSGNRARRRRPSTWLPHRSAQQNNHLPTSHPPMADSRSPNRPAVIDCASPAYRHHTLRQYTYPTHLTQTTSQQLVQLYMTKGHSKEHCAAALLPRRKKPACSHSLLHNQLYCDLYSFIAVILQFTLH